MPIYLFGDTETTGFAKKKLGLIQAGQARVCQQAMMLTDGDGRSLAEISHMIKPDNWAIGAEAGAIHGFTNDHCEKYGISSKSAYVIFAQMASKADYLVAHNAEFDRYMWEIEAAYHGMEFPKTPWLCTKELATPIMAIPPTEKMLQYAFTRDKFKSPNLEEAVQFFCNRSLGDGAHDAMFDVKGCKDVFFAINPHAEIAPSQMIW